MTPEQQKAVERLRGFLDGLDWVRPEMTTCVGVVFTELRAGRGVQVNEVRAVVDLIEQQANQIERLRGVIRQVEWCGEAFTETRMYSICPLCDQTPSRGHSPDCLIGAALEQREVVRD